MAVDVLIGQIGFSKLLYVEGGIRFVIMTDVIIILNRNMSVVMLMACCLKSVQDMGLATLLVMISVYTT